MKIASFFAGIGGFELAFERAGFKVEFNCEVDAFCRAVLKHHWPDVASAGDITRLSPPDVPKVDVWTGGFPCQDVSVARGSNGREGLNGKRSGLFYTFMRLLEGGSPPTVIVLENVTGLLNSHSGRDFRIILDQFMSHGYAVAWRVLNARYFGVPQSRPRVFLVAVKNGPLQAAATLFEREMPRAPGGVRTSFLTPGREDWATGPIVPQTAFCLAATSGRHTGTDWSRSYVSYVGAARRLTPLECERLQGFPDGWTDAGHYGEKAEKVDSKRYKALGNAVAVPVVEWVAARLRTGTDE